MIDLGKLIAWRGQNAFAFAKSVGIDQGGLSKMLKGESSPSAKLEARIIEQVTPTVLFVSHSSVTPSIVNAMLAVGQLDVLESEPEAFQAALKNGLRIGVVTNNKPPFLTMLEQALADSGLSHIPTSGIKVNELGSVEPWNDGDTQCHY